MAAADLEEITRLAGPVPRTGQASEKAALMGPARFSQSASKPLAVPKPGGTVPTVSQVNHSSSSGSDQATSAPWLLLRWMFVALLIYLLPFILITVDEVVLHTNYFSKHLPAGAGDVMRAVYPFSSIFAD